MADASFGWPEAVRITLVALAALNIGTLVGRIRSYHRLTRAARANGDLANLPALRSVLNFYTGFLVIVCSLAWRSVQLYHQPVTVPLLLTCVGLAGTLLGLFRMQRHLAVRVQGRPSGLPRR